MDFIGKSVGHGYQRQSQNILDFSLCRQNRLNAARIAFFEAGLRNVKKFIVIQTGLDKLVLHSQMDHIGSFCGVCIGQNGNQAIHTGCHERQRNQIIARYH